PTTNGHAVSLVTAAAAATPRVPTTPVGSVPQSPIGVATPAMPAPGAGSVLQAPQAVATPAPKAEKLDGQKIDLGPLQSGPHFQATIQQINQGAINPNLITTWASYLGGSGDDRLLGIAFDPTGNAQPLVVVGFSQN